MPEKRLRRSDVGMISGSIAGSEVSGSLRVISPTTECDTERVKELLWTRGSRCVLATEQVSREAKRLLMNIQRHTGCEFVCLHQGVEGIPSEALQMNDN